jgi:hypothetical protein
MRKAILNDTVVVTVLGKVDNLPNCYLVTDGKSTMLVHGHVLSPCITEKHDYADTLWTMRHSCAA